MIPRLFRRDIQLVANTQVHSQLGTDFEIVLEICGILGGPQKARVISRPAALLPRQAKHERRERIARPRKTLQTGPLAIVEIEGAPCYGRVAQASACSLRNSTPIFRKCRPLLNENVSRI